MDAELYAKAEAVGWRFLAATRRIVTAESCTGGWIAKALTDVPGSSQWFECGYVTYSNAAKLRDLGLDAALLEAHGAVSEATVKAMAAGALRVSGVDVAVAVSGIAGPDGGTPDKPVGTVWFAIGQRRAAGAGTATGVEIVAHHRRFQGDRDAVRRESVVFALSLLVAVDLDGR
jgi:nicotinamide-nucleotide amidase